MNKNLNHITIDFHSDLWSEIINIIKKRCIKNLLNIKGLDDDQIFIQYADWLQKQITSAKRVVHYPTQDFKKNIPKHLQKGFESFIKDSQEGNNLKKYQSLKTDTFFKDQLFQHWNIQHFHLNDLPHSKKAGFNGRTKELVFAIILPKDIYILSILDHKSFCKQALIQTIEQAYPNLIDHFPSFCLEPNNLSDQEIHTLRTKNTNAFAFPRIENRTLFLGTGTMSDGTSILNRIKCDRYKYEIKYYDEHWHRDNLFVPYIEKFLIFCSHSVDRNKHYHIMFTLKINNDFNLKSTNNHDLGEHFIQQTYIEYKIEEMP